MRTQATMTELANTFKQTRSESDFTKLYNVTRPLLRNFLRKYFKQHYGLIDDVVSDTMVKVWNKIDLFDSRKSAWSTWVCTIAKNEFIYAMKKKHKELNMWEADLAYKISYDVNDIDEDSLLDARSYIDLLDEPARTYFFEFYIENKQLKRIALENNIIEGSLKTIMFRNRRILRNKVRKLNDIEGN